MADEQYRWLDRDTAERLLRGESPDTVDATVRDQAERLAETLRALSAEAAAPAGADLDLPGEEAALAAFRKVRAEQADARAGLLAGEPGGTGRSWHLRPSWGRPVRLAVSAALAAGALGGVAAAATTGVLPTPFGGREPVPASSVPAQATATPDRLASPPAHGTAGGGPGGEQGGGTGTPTPGASSAGPDDNDARTPAPDGDGTSGTDPDTGQDALGGLRSRLTRACQDLRGGKSLDGGRRRVLEGAAGGSARVRAYCKDILAAVDGQGGGNTGGGWKGKGGQGGNGGGDGSGGGKGGGQKGYGGGGNGSGSGGGSGGGDDDGGHPGGGHPGGGRFGGGHRGAGGPTLTLPSRLLPAPAPRASGAR
ncbi:extensin [Streptomyces sp. NPDC047017]|uniref:extensin n=1 Tax=Streptomyces sp. NPDC047017 TaxID=3155024 RepID=UPI0033F2B3BB